MIWLLAAAAAAVPVCDGDPAQAARDALGRVASGGTPADMAELATCLEALGLPHLAQHHWLELVRHGPTVPGSSHALGRALVLAEHLDDLWSVAWVTARLDEADMLAVKEGRDALLYLHGQQLFYDRQARMAAEVLRDVDPGFRWFPESRLLLARAWEIAGEEVDELEAYHFAVNADDALVRDIATLRQSRRFPGEHWSADLTAASLAALAGESPLRGAFFVLGAEIWHDELRYERARRSLREARRAVRRGGALLPELGPLEARVALDQGRCRAARKRLDRWERDIAPLRLAIAGIAETGSTDGALLFARHLGDEPVDVGLPVGVLERMGSNLEYRGVRAHLDHLAVEEARVRQLGDPAWQEGPGAYLVEVLGAGRAQLAGLAGDLLAAELRQLGREIDAQRERAGELREELGPEGCGKRWRSGGRGL